MPRHSSPTCGGITAGPTQGSDRPYRHGYKVRQSSYLVEAPPGSKCHTKQPLPKKHGLPQVGSISGTLNLETGPAQAPLDVQNLLIKTCWLQDTVRAVSGSVSHK